MKKVVVSTTKAPQAIGPYSQAISTSELVFTSGQLPINSERGGIVDNDIEGQTNQSLINLSEVLKAAGSDLNRVLKTTVYLSDMKNFEKMNKIYKAFFSTGNYPARTAVEVSKLPKDALVEIEAIAYL
jgi:2-iminobutanoate/2-iminopropanoate deaminase